MTLLLDLGAPVDTVNQEGRTALMEAARLGHVEVVRLLIEAGATTELEDHKGQTARVLAERSGHTEVGVWLR